MRDIEPNSGRVDNYQGQDKYKSEQQRSRPPITGEYQLAASAVMQEAARRLGITTSTSEINQSGDRRTNVQEGCTWLSVYTTDSQEDTLFWNTVRVVRNEIESNLALK